MIFSLLKREWRSVRQGGIGGRFRWRSEKEDTLISSQSVVTKDEALALDVKPEKPGLYFFAGEGKDDRGNRFTTSAFFYVTGKDFVPWEPRDRASRSGKFSRMKAAGAEEIFMAGTEPKQPCRFVHGSEAAENPVASVPAAGSDPDIPLKIVFPQLYRQGGDP